MATNLKNKIALVICTLLLCFISGCTNHTRDIGLKYNDVAEYYNSVVDIAQKNAWNNDEDFINTINDVAKSLQSVRDSVENGDINSEQAQDLSEILDSAKIVIEECEKMVETPYDMSNISEQDGATTESTEEPIR